jgi:hypothetical protein
MSGVRLWSGTVIDELRERYEALIREAEGRKEAEAPGDEPHK